MKWYFFKLCHLKSFIVLFFFESRFNKYYDKKHIFKFIALFKPYLVNIMKTTYF